MNFHRFGFAMHTSPGFSWFRIFGYGIAIKDCRRHPLLFSQRYGYARGLFIRQWRIELLTRRFYV